MLLFLLNKTTKSMSANPRDTLTETDVISQEAYFRVMCYVAVESGIKTAYNTFKYGNGFLPSKLCEEDRDSSLLADRSVPLSPLPPKKVSQSLTTIFLFFLSFFILLTTYTHTTVQKFGVTVIFFKKIDHFIKQKCIKSDSKNFHIPTKDYYFK